MPNRMPNSSRLATLALVPLLLAGGVSGAAAAEDGRPPAEPFARNSLGVEFGATALVEAWNLNERREWLACGHVSVWWALHDRVALVMELQATRVMQSPARAGFVQGFTPLVRFRLATLRPLGLFAELGPGISWSDTRVPPRGTRFNYLWVVGGGVSRRLARHAEAVAAFRWLHLSNNGREGRDRNPDIEALGPYAGVRLSF